MPIRFRCPQCEQLLGIARRKAGHSVRCPGCRQLVEVPAEQPVSAPAPPRPPAPVPQRPAPAHPFERDDFEDFLNGPGTVAPHGGPVYEAPVEYGAERIVAPPAPQGLVLSPARVTVLTVVLVLLLALAFGAGLLIGRFY